MFMAEVICCATKQPAIRSRPEGDGSKKRYALEHLSVSGESSGDDSAWSMVSNRFLSYMSRIRSIPETIA